MPQAIPIYDLEVALIADGVPMDKLYPLDVDRAFKKLEELKPHVLVWWSSGAQSAQVLKDGEVDMVGAWNGRIQALDERARRPRAASSAITFDQQILVSDSWMIPKGAPNKELAMKAIAIMCGPEVNARISQLHQLCAVQHRRRYDTGVIPKEQAAQPAELAGEHREGLRPGRRLVGQERRRDGEALRRLRCRSRQLDQRRSRPRERPARLLRAREAEVTAAIRNEGSAISLPISIRERHQDLRHLRRPRQRQPRDRERRVHHAARALGLRQDDAADGAGRLHPARQRRDPLRRPRRLAAAAAQARRRHGVPELRAVPAHERRRQRRLSAAAARGRARRRSPSACRRCSSMVQLGGSGRARKSTSSRAASGSASRSPAPSSSSRASCSWTSRCRRSTRSCASRCRSRSATCISGSA